MCFIDNSLYIEADSVLNISITSRVLIDLKLFNHGFSAYK